MTISPWKHVAMMATVLVFHASIPGGEGSFLNSHSWFYLKKIIILLNSTQQIEDVSIQQLM
jgi:hypothetical protein